MQRNAAVALLRHLRKVSELLPFRSERKIALNVLLFNCGSPRLILDRPGDVAFGLVQAGEDHHGVGDVGVTRTLFSGFNIECPLEKRFSRLIIAFITEEDAQTFERERNAWVVVSEYLFPYTERPPVIQFAFLVIAALFVNNTEVVCVGGDFVVFGAFDLFKDGQCPPERIGRARVILLFPLHEAHVAQRARDLRMIRTQRPHFDRQRALIHRLGPRVIMEIVVVEKAKVIQHHRHVRIIRPESLFSNPE